MWIHTRTVKRRKFGIVYWPLLRTVYFCFFRLYYKRHSFFCLRGMCVIGTHFAIIRTRTVYFFLGLVSTCFFCIQERFCSVFFSSNLNLFNLFWFVIHIVNDLVFSLFFVFFHKVSVFVLSSFVCSFFLSLSIHLFASPNYMYY